jgi:hypothetical protein
VFELDQNLYFFIIRCFWIRLEKYFQNQSYILKVKLNNNISINFVGLIKYSSIGKIIMDGLDWILSLMDEFDFLNEVVIVIILFHYVFIFYIIYLSF